MPEILTRAGKGSDLTPTEADTNFKATARQVTTTTTLATSDNRGIVEGNHASTPFTITLPTVATAAGVDTGEYYTTITNIGAAVVSVDGNGSETINGSTDLLTLSQYSGVTIALNSAKTGWQVTARTGDLGIVTSKEVIIPEQADHTSTPAAGSGYLWVKDDAPNKLKFTDDAGTDYELNTLHTKVIDIGDWDMDATGSLGGVSHGLTESTIRSVNVIIRTDDSATYRPLITGDDGSISISAGSVFLGRTTSGVFDNINYDSTSFNRGWITIQYTD